MERKDLTKLQAFALEEMLEGKNVFLTGEAGTGKSEVIKMFIADREKAGKNILITAPTGTAADNLGGETIHRAFGAPVGVIANSKPVKKREEVLQAADIIVIDEISMCRFDLFEFIAKMIEFENGERARERMQEEIGIHLEEPAKPEIQMIVLGDFYQLPPVLTKEDKATLEEIYHYDFGEGFAFRSVYWDMFDFEPINLTEIVRQDNAAFKKVLSYIRLAKEKEMCTSFLQSHSSTFPFSTEDAIFLSGLNNKVSELNEKKLSELPGKTKTFHADQDGDIKMSEKFAEDVLHLKEGCKVMFTINAPSGEFKNGTMGTVMRMQNNCILIRTADGNIVELHRYTKEITKPTVKETVKNVKGMDTEGNIQIKKEVVKTIEHDVVGSYTQFPLRLAYAITIHKSQGKTFDHVNIDPYCWDIGQFYVAVSRCRSIENICFTGFLNTKYIKASKAIEKKFKGINRAGI